MNACTNRRSEVPTAAAPAQPETYRQRDEARLQKQLKLDADVEEHDRTGHSVQRLHGNRAGGLRFGCEQSSEDRLESERGHLTVHRRLHRGGQ